MSLLRSLTVSIVLFISAYFGALFWQGPLLWLAVCSPKLFRSIIDFTMASWMALAAVCLQFIGGIDVRHFGEPIKPGERALLILNHRTRLDWFYLWCILVRWAGGRCARQEKIVLKHGLNWIPGAGWAMQCAGFIFLRRRWAEDREMMADCVQYFADVGHRCQILLFAEGTNLSADTIARSNKFADENRLPRYQHVLHPRSTGFVHLIQQLRRGSLDAVYDITVAYPSTFPETEPQFAAGNVPPSVHYSIRRYDASSLPADDDGLSRWLTKVWGEKEARLADYYARPERRFEAERQCGIPAWVVVNTVVWVVFLMGIVYLICTSWLWFSFFLVMNTVFIWMCWRHAGVDKWVVGMQRRAREAKCN